MRKQERRQDVCAYCGQLAPDTKDHVPPKQFFVGARPSNLITVPSCSSCNKGFQLNDDYFCDVTSQRIDVVHHPKVKELDAKIARKLERPESEKFKNRVVSQIEIVEVTTPAGIIVGNAPIMNVEHPRISQTARRIVRGLFYHVFKERFPVESHRVVAFNLEQLQVKAARDILTPLSPRPVEEVLKELNERDSVIIGENEFAYDYVSVGSDPYASAWLYTFFGGSPFFGLTYSKELGGEIEIR
jgi:hypothetical protein